MLMYNADNRYVGTISYANPTAYIEAEENGFKFSEPLEGVEPADTYWIDGKAKERPDSPCSFSDLTTPVGGELTISSIPAGSVVKIDGADVGWSDGDIELSAEIIGRYFVEISNWPDKDVRRTLEVIV